MERHLRETWRTADNSNVSMLYEREMTSEETIAMYMIWKKESAGQAKSKPQSPNLVLRWAWRRQYTDRLTQPSNAVWRSSHNRQWALQSSLIITVSHPSHPCDVSSSSSSSSTYGHTQRPLSLIIVVCGALYSIPSLIAPIPPIPTLLSSPFLVSTHKSSCNPATRSGDRCNLRQPSRNTNESFQVSVDGRIQPQTVPKIVWWSGWNCAPLVSCTTMQLWFLLFSLDV